MVLDLDKSVSNHMHQGIYTFGYIPLAIYLYSNVTATPYSYVIVVRSVLYLGIYIMKSQNLVYISLQLFMVAKLINALY